jgi:hypothetical protein
MGFRGNRKWGSAGTENGVPRELKLVFSENRKWGSAGTENGVPRETEMRFRGNRKCGSTGTGSKVPRNYIYIRQFDAGFCMFFNIRTLITNVQLFTRTVLVISSIGRRLLGMFFHIRTLVGDMTLFIRMLYSLFVSWTQAFGYVFLHIRNLFGDMLFIRTFYLLFVYWTQAFCVSSFISEPWSPTCCCLSVRYISYFVNRTQAFVYVLSYKNLGHQHAVVYPYGILAISSIGRRLLGMFFPIRTLVGDMLFIHMLY